METAQLAMIGGGLALVLFIAYLALYGSSEDRTRERRLQQIRFRHSQTTDAKVEAQLKKAVAARKPQAHRIAGSESRLAALSLRLHRTGKRWTISQYFYASGGLALVATVLVYLNLGAILLSLFLGVAIGFAVPHWVVNYFIKRRVKQFNEKFPDAIELLVRGLRSGLPVTETLGVVGREVPGPIGEEFRQIVDRVKVGHTLDESLQETADRLDTPEFKFFCISLAIQRETGGNLAETLANLADVLRKRAQMKLKIKAMSSESKASAYIVGSLPFIVFTMVYWLNPSYLGGFFTDDRLIVAGLGGMVWMSIGGFIMYKMVSFEI